VERVAVGQVSLRVLRFSLSVSFYQCSILIFLVIPRVIRGKCGQGMEPSHKVISGRTLQNYTCTFLGQHSVAQAATCQPSTSECLVRSRANLCKFVGGSSGTGIGLSQLTSVVPIQYYGPSILWCTFPKTTFVTT
jgi:hypothetical protein